jgi:hypothetical protein
MDTTLAVLIGLVVGLFVAFILLVVPAIITGRNTLTGHKLDKDE